MLFSTGKDAAVVSNVKKALKFEDSSPDPVLENTVQLAPSVQHEEVAVSMLALCISIFFAIAVLLMCCVLCVRMFYLHLILQILQPSPPLPI
jgi:uncharacterized membrane protein